jgi:hypothetical protein
LCQEAEIGHHFPLPENPLTFRTENDPVRWRARYGSRMTNGYD